MGWFGRFNKNKKKENEQKSYIYPVACGSILDLSLRQGIKQQARMSATEAFDFYRSSSSVATNIDMIADEIENIKPMLRLPDGKLTSDAEIVEKLKSPNDYETYKAFIGEVVRQYLITGTAFVYVSGQINNAPVEIYAKDPRRVSYQQSTDEYAISYTISVGIGTGMYDRVPVDGVGVRYYSRDELKELFTIRRYSSQSDSKVLGDSPLLAAALDINHGIKGKFHNVKVLENGARLSLLVTFTDNPGEDELKERRDYLNAQYSGSESAGKIAVIGQDGEKSLGAAMTVQELGKTPRDMDFKDLDILATEAIAKRLKIPLPLVSNDASTFNNFERSIEYLYTGAVLPTTERVFEGLSMHLLPRYGLDPSQYQLAYNPEEIPALQSKMIEMIKTRAEIGVETTNELRSLLPNREPIEGGDVLYQPANQVPIGTDIFTEDNTDTTEEQERLAASGD